MLPARTEVKQGKGQGAQRGEIGPVTEMCKNAICFKMAFFMEKKPNLICLVPKLSKL